MALYEHKFYCALFSILEDLRNGEILIRSIMNPDISFYENSMQGRIQRGGGGQGVRTLPEKSQNRGFLSKTGLDPLKNH